MRYAISGFSVLLTAFHDIKLVPFAFFMTIVIFFSFFPGAYVFAEETKEEYKLFEKQNLREQNGSYYLNDKKLDFEANGGELFSVLDSNTESRWLARQARKKYKVSNNVAIPMMVAGIAAYFAGVKRHKDGHKNTDNFLKTAGGVLFFVGIGMKFGYSASGKRYYDLAIDKFNSAAK